MDDMTFEEVSDVLDMGTCECADDIPTREEYENIVGKLYKSFYDEDIERIKKEAENLALDMAEKQLREREEEIRQAAEKALLDKIRAKRQRISEIGVMKNTGNVRRSVSDMTKEERALVAKRAASGEIINLK